VLVVDRVIVPSEYELRRSESVKIHSYALKLFMYVGVLWNLLTRPLWTRVHAGSPEGFTCVDSTCLHHAVVYVCRRTLEHVETVSVGSAFQEFMEDMHCGLY